MLSPSNTLPNPIFYFWKSGNHVQIWKSPCIFFTGTCYSRDHEIMGEKNLLTKSIKFGVNGKNFILVNFCHGTYSWFLSVFGLLTFKECITWPRCKRWICFSSRKTYRIMYHWKENFMLTNICSRIYSWILSILGLLSFKEWVTWPWCKGWICFSCKIFRIWYHWKENFMLINNCSRTPSRF